MIVEGNVEEMRPRSSGNREWSEINRQNVAEPQSRHNRSNGIAIAGEPREFDIVSIRSSARDSPAATAVINYTTAISQDLCTIRITVSLARNKA